MSLIRLAKPAVPPITKLVKRYQEVLRTGMLTNAKYVAKFEKACGQFLGNRNVVAVENGTAGLMLAIIALKLKGEVILPSFTYSSTGHVLLWNGIKPVFADIDPLTFNLDPKDVERKITRKTSAIMPVHCFGNPVDIAAIEKLARKHKLKVIYDAAHAFGSLYKGQPLAKFGDAVVYSFTPTKVLTTAEGGLVAVKKQSLVPLLKLGRYNGDSVNLKEEFLGITARMTEFSAILGLENLRSLKKHLAKRLKLVRYYQKKLKNVAEIIFQKISPGNFSVYRDMTIVINGPRKLRNELLVKLHKNNIQAKSYFSPPLHKKTVYRKWSQNLKLPNTGWLADRIIDLPLHAELTFSEIDKVCNIIKSFINKEKK